MADNKEKDENRLECNENFIDAVFETAFGEGARDRYTNEEVVLKLREFSDNALKFEELENGSPRKIIQIVKTPMDDINFNSITALCDDGTIWVSVDNNDDYDWELHTGTMTQEPVMR